MKMSGAADESLFIRLPHLICFLGFGYKIIFIYPT